MKATISSKGQLVIPETLREQARLKQGDQVDIGYCDGLIVLRKRQPLTPARIRALLASRRPLPESTPEDAELVAEAIRAVRRDRRAAKP